MSQFSQMRGMIKAGISRFKKLGLSREALRADIRSNGFAIKLPLKPIASSVPESDVKQLKSAKGES